MTLHPQCKSFLASIREAAAPAWNEMPLEVARKTFDELPVFGERVEVDNVADDSIAGVPVRIYHISQTAPRDVIVYFHGGGWVLGGIESHDALCRRLAKAADLTVVNVGYRTPPESPFPAAAEDCFTVCDVVATDHKSYSVTNRMLVAGDSAGGNLAASVALMARQRGGPNLAGQVLIYPALDAAMATESYQRFAVDHGLTANIMSWFWEMYAGAGPGGSRTNPLASPAACEDLKGLPPTHLLLAEYDVLRDEGRAYAQRLSAAGVPTTIQQCGGMLHGFFHFAELFDDAETAMNDVAARCRELLNEE